MIELNHQDVVNFSKSVFSFNENISKTYTLCCLMLGIVYLAELLCFTQTDLIIAFYC